MRRTRVIALSALTALLASCGGADDTDSGIPEAAPSDGGGGCEEQHRTDETAWQGNHQNDTGAWQPAAQVYGQQTDSGSWQPPTEPYAVGEAFVVGGWTIQVAEINYDATDEITAALAEQGLSYAGTPIEDWTWVAVQTTLTYNGAGAAAPEADLESRYVDRDGVVYIDFQCGVDNAEVELRQGQAALAVFGVPVPPDQVDGGFWGIGPANETSVSNLAFVR